MAAARDYPAERTSSGIQYLIPGTEARTRPRSTKPELPREGDQYMIPGAEPISTGELLLRLVNRAMQPRRFQRGLPGEGLFRSSPDGD